MRLGLRAGLLLAAVSTVAGCLTTNPSLDEDESTGAEGGSTAATDPTGARTGTAGDASTTGPTTGLTTGVPATEGTSSGDSTAAEETAAPTSESDGPDSCGVGNVCVDEPPAGWSGPVVWADTPVADDSPGCGAAYPELAFEAFDDLQAAPAECDCECGTATGASCAPIVLEHHGSDSSCLTPEDTFTMTGTCSTAPSGASGDYWEIPEPGVTGGSCAPSGTTNIPSASWNSVSTVCGGADAAAGVCGAGASCLPAPPEGFEARACVWQPGQLECPAGAFSDRFVRHAGFDDSRNCETCTCGSAQGECDGTVVLLNSCGGGGGSGNVAIGGSCTSVSPSMSGGLYNAATLSVSNVSCEPSVGTAIGEAEPTDAYTLCCMALEPVD
ncbi:MAG: hypothetical protein ACRBN8_11985 [Nannocystales bacterium]